MLVLYKALLLLVASNEVRTVSVASLKGHSIRTVNILYTGLCSFANVAYGGASSARRVVRALTKRSS